MPFKGNVKLTLYLTPTLRDQFVKACHKQKISYSDLGTEIIAEYLLKLSID